MSMIHQTWSLKTAFSISEKLKNATRRSRCAILRWYPSQDIEMDHMGATEGWMLPPDLDILFKVLSRTRVSQGEKAI